MQVRRNYMVAWKKRDLKSLKVGAKAARLLRNLFIELFRLFLTSNNGRGCRSKREKKNLMIWKRLSKEKKKKGCGTDEDSQEIYDFCSHIPTTFISLINSVQQKAFFLSVQVERIVNNHSTNGEKCFFLRQVNKNLFFCFASSNSPRTDELNYPINYLLCLFHILRFTIVFLRRDMKFSWNSWALFHVSLFSPWKAFQFISSNLSPIFSQSAITC